LITRLVASPKHNSVRVSGHGIACVIGLWRASGRQSKRSEARHDETISDHETNFLIICGDYEFMTESVVDAHRVPTPDKHSPRACCGQCNLMLHVENQHSPS
jgi:hypothetical protein